MHCWKICHQYFGDISNPYHPMKVNCHSISPYVIFILYLYYIYIIFILYLYYIYIILILYFYYIYIIFIFYIIFILYLYYIYIYIVGEKWLNFHPINFYPIFFTRQLFFTDFVPRQPIFPNLFSRLPPVLSNGKQSSMFLSHLNSFLLLFSPVLPLE